MKLDQDKNKNKDNEVNVNENGNQAQDIHDYKDDIKDEIIAISSFVNNAHDYEVFAIHSQNGFSGYNFWKDGKLCIQIYLSYQLYDYFLIKKQTFQHSHINHELSFGLYNSKGENVQICDNFLENNTIYTSTNYYPQNAFYNQIYNLIEYETSKYTQGLIDEKRIITLKRIINDLKFHIRDDQALDNIKREVMRVEKSSVYKRAEKDAYINELKKIYKKILHTKTRAHGQTQLKNNIVGFMKWYQFSLERIKSNPKENLLYLLNALTIGRLQWFLNTVKQNLGLSIAMAIYGPFTYFFITQPMNPHAMQVVGMVREFYVDLTSTKKPRSPQTKKTSTTQNQAQIAKSLDNPGPMMMDTSEKNWEKRMSQFKAMHINYESALVVASRMGRLEHFENQLLFPMTIEALWSELLSYENKLKNSKNWNKDLPEVFEEYLKQELKRIDELKLYTLEKLKRYLRDHPYLVMDQENKHPYTDYHNLKAFELVREISENLKLSIESEFQTENFKNKSNTRYLVKENFWDEVLANAPHLNSLSSYKDGSLILDSEVVRKNLKRHWEVLFLQQNKKQEAASFALQAYTWSIRNYLWIQQVITSTLSRDFDSLQYFATRTEAKWFKNMNFHKLMSTFIHFATLEPSTIEEEFFDQEISQREKTLQSLKKSLILRDRVLSSKDQVNLKLSGQVKDSL